MQDNLFLSIIIPFYKVELSLLDRCLSSITEQLSDKQAWEVIVVDDASPESPAEVCRRHPLTRLVVQEHRGLGGARNNGMRQAQGTYVLFVDADDYLFDGTLNTLWKMLLTKQPDILRFGFQAVTGFSRKHVRQKPLAFKTFETGRQLMEATNLYDSACFYAFRLNLATNHGIVFEENVFLEDSLFTVRLHHVARTVVVTSLKVYAYFQRPDSIVRLDEQPHQEELVSRHWDNLLALNNMMHSEPAESARGLRRKCRFYVIDYLRRLFQTEDVNTVMDDYLPSLRQRGLFPLPYQRAYGFKYNAFCLLMRSRVGMSLLSKLSK
ncbi:MAG: glycosyltransferase family 2 protein [Bacteroidaceae bacterium]|nr:glycosyltransferase family 2 protein [Bacteroidaceae bacterium]